jgi:EAL domain-containing protein (putative c-di-GMP-specific phosphodiesterase class I)
LWSQAGVHAVGINLRGVPKNEKAFMTGMEELAARAEQSKLRTFVHGLETISMATIAVSAGIDYIEGNAVRAPVKSLEHVRPFETENLLAHLLPS